MKRVKRIEWNNVSLVVDVAVCSHFAGFIASVLVFIKARSLRSLTSTLTLVAINSLCSDFTSSTLLPAFASSCLTYSCGVVEEWFRSVFLGVG